MYFGSVRFFKHLIILLLLLCIIVPTTLAVIFKVQKDEAELKLATVSAINPDPTVQDELLTASEIIELAEENNIEVSHLVKLLYALNPSAFKDIIEANAADYSPADNDSPAEYESAYSSLFHELYVENSGAAAYADDYNHVYLTFDDGPSPYTEDILAILGRYDIKATFFLSPEDTETDFELMRMIVDNGHSIGIHTYSHVYEDIYASVDAYLEDFNTAFNLVYQATGQKCRLFRFPGGSMNSYNGSIRADLLEEMSRRGFVYFDWNVDSEDGIGANWTEMYNNVLTEIENAPRAFILMHDGIYNTTLVLEDIITALSADTREFTFSAITDDVRPLQF